MASSPHNSYHSDFPKLIRESGYIFDSRKTNSRIDWNEIKAIDVERIVLERDFRTIDNHIYEVLSCHLDTEFDLRILDSGFVKLFRLAQLSVEYLLQCRRQMDAIIASAKEEMKQIREEKEYLKRQMNGKEEEMRKLNNKLRKRHKSAGPHKYDEISEFLKNLVLNGSTNTTLSVGEQNLAALYKCVHCEKLFLNQFFLQSHVTRRHLYSAINANRNNTEHEENMSVVQANTSSQDNDYKLMTEKLYQEIKEVRERLSIAEKRHFDELFNAANKTDDENVQKEEVESNEKPSVSQNAIESQRDVQVVEVEPKSNSFTKEMFEEWRKEEQNKYISEIAVLKTQLLETINTMKDNMNESSAEKNDSKYDSEKISNITAALNKQENEVKMLREQLQNKSTSNQTEVTSRLEEQEKFWKSKVELLEVQCNRTIEELRTNMTLQTNEFQSIQQQYKGKIEHLEKNLKEQSQNLEYQSQKLESISDTKKVLSEMTEHYQHLSKNIQSQKTQNAILVESQESLPPYDDEGLKSKVIQESPKRNKIIENKKNNFFSDSSTEMELIDDKIIHSNYSQPQRHNKGALSPKKLFTDEIQDDNNRNKLKKERPLSSKKPNEKSKLTRLKNSNNSLNLNSKKATKQHRFSTTTDSDSELEETSKKPPAKTLTNNRERFKYDNIENNSDNILANKPNLAKAVKKDLQLVVKKRLHHIGVQPKSKGIPTDDYKKGIKLLQHKQQLMSKQYHSYNKHRKSIVKNLNDKLKQLDMSERTSTSSILEQSKPNSPFRVMGSLLSNVKNKAMNIVKSRENLRIDLDAVMPRKMKILESNKQQMTASQSSEEVNSSTPNKISAKSILAMLNSRDTTEMKKANSKEVISKDIQDLHESSESSEESSDQDSDEDSDQNKIGSSNKIVTTAISHMPSKSIENLLNSPIRKPNSMIQQNETKFSSPIRTIEAPKITVPKSELQLHSPGRFSKSEIKVSSNNNLDDSISLSETETGDDTVDIKSFLPRKAISEDNVSTKQTLISPKSVLKSVSSVGSLTKKKVLFDLNTNDATQNASESTYATDKNSSLDELLKMKITDWDISENVEEVIPEQNDPDEVINLSTKQSPKIAEISKLIQSQLGARSTNPPAGSVETMFQAESVQVLPKKTDDNTTINNNKQQPVPAPRVTSNIKSKVDSDLELSDWSMDS